MGNFPTTRNEKNEPQFRSPYIINPVEPFELVRLPDGAVYKLAHEALFDRWISDFEIELSFIQKYEFASSHRRAVLEMYTPDELVTAKEKLKYHYRRCVWMVSPRMAKGWNRWSEYILDLFLDNKLYKVCWGSGGCGKSAVYGLLRYIRWRVNPTGRMCVVCSMVVKESKARVFGYISEYHTGAPAPTLCRIENYKGKDSRGIYTQIQDKSGKWMDNERGCIIPLPIKVDADKETFGDNLIGLHPEDALDIDFDEGQEIPGSITEMKIIYNWLSNPKVSVNAWGNPSPAQFFAKQDYDLLFKLGVGNMTEPELKEREKCVEKCDRWEFKDTSVLRLSTTDSPKDDESESENWYLMFGERKHRLEFLSGKDSISQLPEGVNQRSAAYYSQVYGFPFIDYSGEWSKGVLSPAMVELVKNYPLMWKSLPGEMKWYMGVDSAPTGTGDACSIVCGRLGMMMDGRLGIDLMNGQYCRTLYKDAKDDRPFTDYVVDTMLWLAGELRIPLSNVAVETHSSGEVLKYALQKSIDAGKWGNDWKWSGKFFVVSPVISPTDRHLFKELGVFTPAEEIVSDIGTEYWLAVRCAVQTRQIFNIPDNILGQFYNRMLGLNSNSTKYKVESKKDMSKRGVKSPNDADALTNLLEIMRRRGGFGYRFRTTGSYQEFFSPERAAAMLKDEVDMRLSRVADALGLSGNFGRSKAQNINKGHFGFDSI